MRIARRTLIASSAAAAVYGRPPAPALRSLPPDSWMPKLSEKVSDVKTPTLRWLKQLGCNHVDFHDTQGLDADKRGHWTLAEVQRVKKACEDAGLTLESMGLPVGMFRNAMLGRPDRDREIENVCRTIRAVGEAGVPVMRWNFGPDYLWGEQVGYRTLPGRGGAGYTDWDYSRIRDAPAWEEFGTASPEEMWKNCLYVARPMMEAAEKASVRMALHPNDPPSATMRTLARLFHHTDVLRRFHQAVPSPVNGLCFCQGTVAEMGVNVLDEIRYFGSRNRIFHVHFRNVRGRVPHYTEVFIDEGDVDMLQAMKAYKEVGYTGLLVSDHTPRVEGDTRWGHIGRAYSLGYMRALVRAANAT